MLTDRDVYIIERIVDSRIRIFNLKKTRDKMKYKCELILTEIDDIEVHIESLDKLGSIRACDEKIRNLKSEYDGIQINISDIEKLIKKTEESYKNDN